MSAWESWLKIVGVQCAVKGDVLSSLTKSTQVSEFTHSLSDCWHVCARGIIQDSMVLYIE